MKPAVFLDRDGVINQEVDYLYKIDDFKWTHRAIEALQNISKAGYIIVIVTNQSGIGRGYYTEADYQKLTHWYLAELKKAGVSINTVKHCPHHPTKAIGEYRQECSCRKPKPGMLLEAIAEHNIDAKASIMVGDKISDIQASKAAGIDRGILVRSGHELPQLDDKDFDVFDDLYGFSVEL